jgi:hypothetical protein
LELYEELQAHGVDQYLIGAVTAGANRAPVTWVDEAHNPAEFGKHAGLIVDQLSVHNTIGSFIESLPRRWRLEWRDAVPQNVGEALAWELRRRLNERKKKRNANKREGDKKGPAPVRSRGSSVLDIGLFSKIAADLLDECRFSGYPPGPQLSALIQELLGADRPRLKDTEKYSARDQSGLDLCPKT